MTYEEFNELSNGMFTEFKSVKEAKKIGWIPEEYHECIDDKCSCGSDRIISQSLAKIRCCDPKCYIKQGFSLEAFLKKFGAKGIGENTCIMAMKELQDKFGKYFSYTDLLKLRYMDFPPSLQGSYGNTVMSAIRGMLYYKISFAELITSLGIPGLDTGSAYIFENLSSAQDFIAEIERCGGVNNFYFFKGVSDRAKIFNTFVYFRDIINVYNFMCKNIRRAPLRTVDIVLTGRIYFRGESYTKDEYIRWLNDACVSENGIQLCQFRNSKARESAPYIIASFDNGSASYLAGLRRRANGQKNVLQTPDSFAKIVEKEVEEFNENWRREH